ncbi:unnamed protein product [Toxocara canis]|uniref:Transmembrane protein n=1 Tax=Toxocara canis TaxID=6265 RepID=A0A183U0Y1_TOXCA|nr:unnamed protein product [Toxocara canis]
MHRGLWKQCTRYLIDTQCVNRFSKLADDVREVMLIGANVFDGNRTPISGKKLQVFEWVILALMLISIGLSVLSLLCSPCCCNHCNCCLSFWVFFAGICSACACIWYAYQNQIGQTLTFNILQPDDLPLYRMHNQLAWSFYLAVCGSICQVMSGVFFACTKSRRSTYAHSV